MTVQRTHVVNVGGSLLENQWLPERLQRLLEMSPHVRHVIVVGGGPLVNTVRRWDKTHRLSQAWCHWSSIRLMSETARMLAHICSLPLADCIDELPETGDSILDCMEFMANQSNLPHSWRTTSDSIAAEIADSLEADELLLLKSAMPASPEVAGWSEDGFVDVQFTQAIENTWQVVVVNLADPDLLSIRGI